MDPARAGKAVSAVGRARNLSNERRVTMDVSAGGLVASLMRGSVLSEHQRRYRISVALANFGPDAILPLRAQQNKLTAHKAQRLTRALSSAHFGAAFRVSILP